MKKWLDIAARAAAFTAVCVCVSNSAHADSPERIGSTSLCGDAYLRAIAPEHLAALSWQSRDPVSLASSSQRALPQLWDDPEVLLAAEVDHIVFGPFEGSRSSHFLTRPHTSLAGGEDFKTVKANFTLLGKTLNQKRLAQAINDNIDERLSRLKTPARKPRILYLSSSGGSAHHETFVTSVIEAAGGENILIEYDKEGAIIPSLQWPKPDPEILLSLKPDLILTSYFDESYASINEQALRNKTLSDFIARHPRLEIPGALWPCAGPGLVEAAELLNAKILELTQ